MAEAPSAHAGKLPTGQRATAAKGSDADIEEMLAKLKAWKWKCNQRNLIFVFRAFPFFLSLASSDRPKYLAFSKNVYKYSKKEWRSWTCLNFCDHALLFPGSTAMMLVFQASYS